MCSITPYGSKVVVLYASASKPSETIWKHLKPHHFCQLSLAFPNFPPSRRLVGPVSFACAKPPGWPSCQRRRARCCASARCSWRCWRPRRAPWSQRLGALKDSGRGWHWEKWCLFWVGIFGVRWSRRWDDSGFDYSIYIYICVCEYDMFLLQTLFHWWLVHSTVWLYEQWWLTVRIRMTFTMRMLPYILSASVSIF